jgi:hypothetical protein
MGDFSMCINCLEMLHTIGVLFLKAVTTCEIRKYELRKYLCISTSSSLFWLSAIPRKWPSLSAIYVDMTLIQVKLVHAAEPCRATPRGQTRPSGLIRESR